MRWPPGSRILWKLAPGDAFDESYVSSFAARAQKQESISGEMDANRHHDVRREAGSCDASSQLHLPLREGRAGRPLSEHCKSGFWESV